MKKRFTTALSFLLAFMLLMPSGALAEAESAAAAVQLDGDAIDFGNAGPFVENGTTFAPVRPLFDAFGLSLDYDEQANTVAGIAEGFKLEFEIGGQTAVLNDDTVQLAYATPSIDDTLYVPVRFVAESLGYEVGWDQRTRTVALELEVAQGGRGFLWEVTNGGTTVYLLGSMHVADDSFYPLDDAIEQAFESSDYLGVEVDISNAEDPAVQQLVLSLGMYPEGETLQDHVSADTYAKIGEFLQANGMPANSMDAFKPWVVDTVIQSMKAGAAGLEGQVGIDLYFLTKAIERQMPIIELESYESQLRMFDDFSDELQETLLLNTLEAHDTLDEDIQAVADMWKSGDDQALIEFTESANVDEEYYKAMIVDRNLAMTEKIAEYLNGGEEAVYMIVVGAAHMLGEDGIVTNLQQQGYEVERK